MENLKIEDIPCQYQDIATFMGIDKFIEFCRYFGGSYIYVPNIKTFEAKIRDRDIIKMSNNGIGTKVIAKKYNVTTNYIGKILKKYK